MGSLRTTPSSCIVKTCNKDKHICWKKWLSLLFAVQLSLLVFYGRQPSAPLLHYFSWWQRDIDSWGFKAVTCFCCIFCLLLFLCMTRYCKWCSVSLYKAIRTSDFKVQRKRNVWTNSALLSICVLKFQFSFRLRSFLLDLDSQLVHASYISPVLNLSTFVAFKDNLLFSFLQ